MKPIFRKYRTFWPGYFQYFIVVNAKSASLGSEGVRQGQAGEDDEGVPLPAEADPHGVHHTGREVGLSEKEAVALVVKSGHLNRDNFTVTQ